MATKQSQLVVRVGVYPHRVEQTVGWERSALATAGVAYEYRDIDSPDLDAILETADVVLIGGGQWPAARIRRLSPGVKLISCTVGLDHIDVQAARDVGITVVNMPDLCTDEVADHTMALILACVRKVTLLNNQVHAGIWDRTLLEPMPRLRGKTLGLYGFGRIGRAVAERARAFGMDIVATDPYVDQQEVAESGVPLVEMARLCEVADIVSIHTPLTAHTKHAFGRTQLRALKPTAYIVNTSRGPIIDEVELIAALQERRLAGAGLDVLESEPPHVNSPLRGLSNVVLTPHAGGFSDEVVDNIPRLAVDAAIRTLQASGRSGDVPTSA